MPNRIESAKKLNTGTKIWDHPRRTRQQSFFLYFWRKNGRVGSYKTGSIGKHTYFFFLALKESMLGWLEFL